MRGQCKINYKKVNNDSRMSGMMDDLMQDMPSMPTLPRLRRHNLNMAPHMSSMPNLAEQERFERYGLEYSEAAEMSLQGLMVFSVTFSRPARPKFDSSSSKKQLYY